MSSFASLFKKKKNHLLGKRQKEHDVLKDGALLVQELIASCDGKVHHPIRSFSANEIIKAMEDSVFHDNNDPRSIQYGGSYEDRKIFIKIYEREHIDLFINEVVSIAQINHRNVVKLLGYCLEMQSPVMVSELLPNTLYDLLRTENRADQISWENRLRIAIEIADVVTYLHIAKPRPIIHRDIKSSNIFLDEHCRPKLCGFCLSIAIPLGETHVETDTFAGTMGYLDPNYMATCIVTEKVDVYSFGWVMLEILSRKGPCELASLEERNGWKKTIKDEEVLKRVKRLSLISDGGLLVDTRKIEQVIACVELAVRCIADEQDQRPTMREVALKLRQIQKHQLPCSSPASSSSL